jgi:hypothetical protein
MPIEHLRRLGHTLSGEAQDIKGEKGSDATI